MKRPTSNHSFLRKLNAGEADAIEQAFHRFGWILRKCVSRRMDAGLRGKVDSEDVVHSLWLRLLPGLRDRRWQFDDSRQLRAFLIKSACNRLRNRARHLSLEARYVQDRLHGGFPHLAAGGAEGALAAEELWERLLAVCPPAHRDILLLKRQGWSLDQIAAAKAMHKSSVRRILYETFRRLD